MKIANHIGKRPVEDFLVEPGDSLRHVMSVIDANGKGVAVVIDERQHFKAVISDGDIRRWLLSDASLKISVANYLEDPSNQRRQDALTLPNTTSADKILTTLSASGARFIPLLDDKRHVSDVAVLMDLVQEHQNPIDAVVMAGGRGTRLRPYTDPLPKPMLPINGRPLLERIIEGLSNTGIENVSIATHYRREKIVDHFGDGQAFGLNVNYIDEDRPLGTAGALKFVDEGDGPLLVMNGDIVSDINISAMKHFHEDAGAKLTMAAHCYKVEIPYGVARCDGIDLVGIDEKPTYSHHINAGIYLIERKCLKLIPEGKYFDMTDLIEAVQKAGLRTVVYPFEEQWLDVGQHDDYRKAQTLGQSASGKPAIAHTNLPRLVPAPRESRNLIIGGTGLVGTALKNALKADGASVLCPSRSELDLSDVENVRVYLAENPVDCLYMLAGKTGTMPEVREKPVDFLQENINQLTTLLDAAHRAGVARVLIAGSAAVYPKSAPVPLREEALMTGSMASEMEPYGLAKAVGAKLCEYYQRQHGRAYSAAIIGNIYGPAEQHVRANSQFIPSILARFAYAVIEGKNSVEIWGTGRATRDFLHISDCVSAMIHTAQFYAGATINIGSGIEVSIRHVVELVAKVSGYKGEIIYDAEKPEGVARSCLDTGILKSLGWNQSVSLEDGVKALWQSMESTTPMQKEHKTA